MVGDLTCAQQKTCRFQSRYTFQFYLISVQVESAALIIFYLIKLALLHYLILVIFNYFIHDFPTDNI
jgi:uncharacterized membrane protein YdbT with pleckstrin-like domain